MNTIEQRTADLFSLLESGKDIRRYVVTALNLIDDGVLLSQRQGRASETLLLAAVGRYQTDIAIRLIEAGSNCNAYNALGCTPLHLAIQNSQDRVARIMINHGADIYKKSMADGYTALHFAAQQQIPDLLQELVEAGMPVNSLAGVRATPLYAAADANRMDSFMFLLENGASISSLSHYDQKKIPAEIVLAARMHVIEWQPKLEAHYEPQNKKEVMHLISVMPVENIEAIPDPRELIPALFRTLPYTDDLNTLYKKCTGQERVPEVAAGLKEMRAQARGGLITL